MFWLKKRITQDPRFSQLHELLAKSFAHVKKDTTSLFQWTNYLYQKSMEQESTIKRLETELSYIPKKPEDIKRIIDSYYSYENIIERIKLINEKIDALKEERAKVEERPREIVREKAYAIGEIEQRLEKLEQQKKQSMREKMVKRLTRNSKEYIRNMILSYIRKYTQIGALQLKDIIVDEQVLCSKSSFYRILEEIEALEEIDVAKKGREKYYLYKAMKHV